MQSHSISVVALAAGPHERQYHIWDDPIQISVVYSLVIFIHLDIEILEAVPAKLDCKLQPLKDLEHAHVVSTGAATCVSEWNELGFVNSQSVPCFLCSTLQNDDLERAHQCDHVCLVVILRRTVMIDLAILVLRIIQQSHEFATVTMGEG